MVMTPESSVGIQHWVFYDSPVVVDIFLELILDQVDALAAGSFEPAAVDLWWKRRAIVVRRQTRHLRNGSSQQTGTVRKRSGFAQRQNG